MRLFAGIDFVPAIVIGGSLFVFVILFVGYKTSGYSHSRQSLSELGIPGSAYGWLVRWGGFVPLGLSFIVFACQSGNLFSNQVPFVLFILIGLAISLVGIFPTDPDNRRDTISGKTHANAVISLLLLLTAAPFTFSISSFYRNPPAGWFFIFSSLMGIFVLAFLIFSAIDINLLLASLFRKNRDRFEKKWHLLLGLQQRLLLSFHYIWWFVFIQVLADEDALLSSISTVHFI